MGAFQYLAGPYWLHPTIGALLTNQNHAGPTGRMIGSPGGQQWKAERERESLARERFQRCHFAREQRKAQQLVLLLMSLFILFSFDRFWISSHSTTNLLMNWDRLEVDGSSFLSWQFILGQDTIGHMVLRQCAVYCSLYQCNSTTFYVLFKVKLMSITVWSWVCKALIHSICILRAAPPVSTSKCPLSLSILRTLSNWIWRTCFWKHKYLTGFEIAHVPFLKKLTFNLFSPIQL